MAAEQPFSNGQPESIQISGRHLDPSSGMAEVGGAYRSNTDPVEKELAAMEHSLSIDQELRAAAGQLSGFLETDRFQQQDAPGTEPLVPRFESQPRTSDATAAQPAIQSPRTPFERSTQQRHSRRDSTHQRRTPHGNIAPTPSQRHRNETWASQSSQASSVEVPPEPVPAGEPPTFMDRLQDTATAIDAQQQARAERNPGDWRQKVRRWGRAIGVAAGLTAATVGGVVATQSNPDAAKTHQSDNEAARGGMAGVGETSPTGTLPARESEPPTVDELVAKGEPLTAPPDQLPPQAGYHHMREPGSPQPPASNPG